MALEATFKETAESFSKEINQTLTNDDLKEVYGLYKQVKSKEQHSAMFHYCFSPSSTLSPWALLSKPLAYSILVSQLTWCQIKRAQYYCLLGVGGRLQHDEAGHARLEGEGQVGQLELQEGDDQVSLSIYKRDSFTWKRDHLFQGGRHETIYWVCEAAVWETRQKVLKKLYVYGKIGRRQIKNAVFMQEKNVTKL